MFKDFCHTFMEIYISYFVHFENGHLKSKFKYLRLILTKYFDQLFLTKRFLTKGGAASGLYYTSRDYQINISQHGRNQ